MAYAVAYPPPLCQTVQSTIDKFGTMEELLSSNEDDDGKHKIPSFVFSTDFMSSQLYQLSPPEDLTLATMLARPLPMFGRNEDYSNEDALTKQNYGSVPRAFHVVCEKDNLLKKEFPELLIENNPPDEVRVISGADHMPMFSKPDDRLIKLEAFANKILQQIFCSSGFICHKLN